VELAWWQWFLLGIMVALTPSLLVLALLLRGAPNEADDKPERDQRAE
jgi:hydrogenase-4 membrane subunit HyfE